ncbi:MAG: DUF2179 domain-containing protein [Candidatus Tectomicrobia bacterium]|nr:DUF2179 domain-containing protein [Candidatus Tectomicrobia bacterium]
MDGTVIITCLLIVVARVIDVSLGTLRTVSVVQGRCGVAWVFGFVEVLIWIAVVSKVIQSLDQPVYALSYAIGFATGSSVGITLEKWISYGQQVVRIFTREGARIGADLRAKGFSVVSLEAEDADGPLQLLFIQNHRKDARSIARRAREIDPKCFYTVDDIRAASQALMLSHQPTGWRAILKKK